MFKTPNSIAGPDLHMLWRDISDTGMPGSRTPTEIAFSHAGSSGIAVEAGAEPPGSTPFWAVEHLARRLAEAQAELDRLHVIARRAGYRIIFCGPGGIVIDHRRSTGDGVAGPQARGGLAPGVLRRVRAHVEANLESRIELAGLAAIANLSRCHFAHAFKQSLGCTPHRYVMSRRLEKARGLLATSSLAIVEVALATGFADQSHFSRCFRGYFGISPRAFQRAQR